VTASAVGSRQEGYISHRVAAGPDATPVARALTCQTSLWTPGVVILGCLQTAWASHWTRRCLGMTPGLPYLFHRWTDVQFCSSSRFKGRCPVLFFVTVWFLSHGLRRTELDIGEGTDILVQKWHIYKYRYGRLLTDVHLYKEDVSGTKWN